MRRCATSLQRSGEGAAGSISCRSCLESLWKDFFRDPSQWWDNRIFKPRLVYPDFVHKDSGLGLWLHSLRNSSWVAAELRRQGLFDTPPVDTQIEYFNTRLKACARKKDLLTGMRLHHNLVRMRLIEQCSDVLAVMYANCDHLGKAKVLLDMHKSKDNISWTALMAGYLRKGQGERALDCFEQMKHDGISITATTYCCALKACAMTRAVDKGRHLHNQIVRQGLLQNVILGNLLVHMYAKCGATLQAWEVLEEIHSRNIFSWAALISGHAHEGEFEQALICLEQMQQEGILPDGAIYAMALKSCATNRASVQGKQTHKEFATESLTLNHTVMGGGLADVYAKCGLVLKQLPSRNVFSWKALFCRRWAV
ncbi:hypothetical protein GOP47_0025101 [Adiantum capillus-veneris]|uniref:Pentatricopeptide repeat-containing protein n=1 Tax=Adiantum capillus-veneris TaxID=13818 RepID=A0A9D4U312_ADICA|nr:hypothetical protein GOP47_0025101 [Adiantum capillus-veneris]